MLILDYLFSFILYSYICVFDIILSTILIHKSKKVREEQKQKFPAKAGSAKGKIWRAEDFNAPLAEFEEYM